MGKLKILVTGAAGFLGAHLCDKLQNLHHKVIGIDNMIGGDLDNLPKNLEFHKIDCCDFRKLDKITKNIDDLSEKIQKLSLDDDLRKKIARKGWIKYHKYFNSKVVSDYMLNKVFNLTYKDKTLWGN